MEIRWSPEAAGDLEHIVNRVRRDNPQAARQVAIRLYNSCASLESFPNRGRTGRIAGTRDLFRVRIGDHGAGRRRQHENDEQKPAHSGPPVQV